MAVVHEGDGFGVATHTQERHNRPEAFLLDDGHVMGAVHDNRGHHDGLMLGASCCANGAGGRGGCTIACNNLSTLGDCVPHLGLQAGNRCLAQL